jgi:hypothetical protein
MSGGGMTAHQRPKRHHHHVWQHYLKTWTIDGGIFCLQDGRIFATGTRVVAVQKDFYKLEHLTREDVALIKLLFEKSNPHSKQANADLLNQLMIPFQLLERTADPAQRAMIAKYVDEYASDVLENYHARIEADFIPILQCALRSDLSFYHDERCIPFMYFLCTQYLRTRGIKERVLNPPPGRQFFDMSRIWNVLIHMFATNSAGSLYVERKRRKLILVNNRSAVPFVTGDQPAINLKGTRPEAPERFSVYYPISPQLALILADIDEQPLFPAEGLTDAQASYLNKRLATASYKQVFAKARASLKAVRPS